MEDEKNLNEQESCETEKPATTTKQADENAEGAKEESNEEAAQ